MRPLVIAFVVLAGTVYSNMALIEKLHNKGLVKNPIHIRAIYKREIDKSDSSAENFYTFIEEKLMHQNQALEHLITSVDNTGDMIKKLIDNLSKGLEQPKMPTKAEPEKVPKPKLNVSTSDHPLVKLGKNIPKYGRLAKDLLMKEVISSTDPTPIIEVKPTLSTPGSRRSLDDSAVGSDQQSEGHKVNPWCPIALLCQKKVDPVCGFDDEFGYGRFEDFCHLLRVNCYWKYSKYLLLEFLYLQVDNHHIVLLFLSRYFIHIFIL
ncbi:uncharacterized protein LOC118278215 isoform X1 [Spodoptera frugiperda]|uniref:Uncharacterized protein LOC118278215 isoform X1 n=1 Tax=Spodoptera frugiperda TaxID=7108 RepID=A0A9R0ERR6_SPOFR|nr:uncharacterized protein LOC118278215 isoform X1 [Spodoptera frugiperda]